MENPDYLDRAPGRRLALRHRRGRGPTIVFLPGYMSDMEGGKASALDSWAEDERRAMLRFDYSGCGLSEGAFEAQTLAGWRDDSLAMIDSIERPSSWSARRWAAGSCCSARWPGRSGSRPWSE
jgi:pimeloyl-ACP methyl ester carboxylesterase